MKKIAEDLYYVGVNDRRKLKFEDMWPLPKGITYNSYLIKDEKTALFDTMEISFSDLFLRKVAEVLDGRTLDYVIVDHMEPDHAGSIRLLRQYYPDVQIVGNKKSFDMLKGFHNIDTGLKLVGEGDTLSLGRHNLTFYMAPMVHWPEVMVAYDSFNKSLFSADAFGSFGAIDGGVIDEEMNTDFYWDEMERYYSNIIGKYGAQVQRALSKIKKLDLKMICSTHGPVWKKHLNRAMEVYDRLSRYEAKEGVVILYASMYGHTEQLAETIAQNLAEAGVKNIVMHCVSNTSASYILRDIFHYKGLIVGSPTYCNDIHPDIESILSKIKIRGIKNRTFGYFSTFSWANAAEKKLDIFAKEMKWEVVSEPVQQRQNITKDSHPGCKILAEAMAKKLTEE